MKSKAVYVAAGKNKKAGVASSQICKRYNVFVK